MNVLTTNTHHHCIPAWGLLGYALKGDAMKLEDFYRICDAIEPDEYGCKNYRGASRNLPIGYHYVVKIDGKQYHAHRLVLERKLGRPIKPGYQANHHCDNPSCVNPDHLKEGTYKENRQDAIARNRLNPEWTIEIARKASKAHWDKYRTDPDYRTKKKEQQRKAGTLSAASAIRDSSGRFVKNPKNKD